MTTSPRALIATLAVGTLSVLAGCWAPDPTPVAFARPVGDRITGVLTDSTWRDGATCYQLIIRSFADGDGDGIGDLRGAIGKLDHLNDGRAGGDDLGVRCLWLTPFVAGSAYHGYEITDPFRVDPPYGTNDDARTFVAAAHARGIAVFVDLVLNHVSDQHPYFAAAVRDPASPYRTWFRFIDTAPTERWANGQPLWHPTPDSSAWYYGVFWHTMPDLNYDTPAVRAYAKQQAGFWLRDIGVDGFRLDAVPYLIEDANARRDTEGTHAFLREWQQHVDSIAPNAFTIGEAWDGLDVTRAYWPDQLDAYFAFDLSDSLITAVRDRRAAGVLARWSRYEAEIPAQRYATFARNHDQTRTITALGGDSAAARITATVLLTLPGLPFVYYGEELGMPGDKPDERLRTPMPWDASPHGGFTTGTPWQPLAEGWERANVAAARRDSTSLLALYRTLIALRASEPSLARGRFVALPTDDPAMLAFVRDADGASPVLIVANLADTAAPVALPLTVIGIDDGSRALTPLVGGAPSWLRRTGDRMVSPPVPPRSAWVARVTDIIALP